MIPPEILAAVDLGGTNLRLYELHPRETPNKVLGRNLLGEKDIKTKTISSNQDLSRIVLEALYAAYGTTRIGIGISAAGDVDEESLVIKTSPNLGIEGIITLGKDLASERFNVVEGNDMRCAASGARRWGQGNGIANFIIATYSTGHNICKVENGVIVTRSEFGHQPYHSRIKIPEWARNLRCGEGCGGSGHLEPYVSGSGTALMARNYFTTRFSQDYTLLQVALDKHNKKTGEKLKLKHIREDDNIRESVLQTLDARDVYEALRKEPRENPQKAIARIQTHAIADSFGMMISDFNPVESIICMGSMTKDWPETFQPAIDMYRSNIANYHLHTLNSPQIVRNSVRKIGCVGAGSFYLDKRFG